MERNTFEFIVQFERIPSQTSNAEKHTLFKSNRYRTKPHQVKIVAKSTQKGNYQLYYHLEGEFNEIQSVSQNLNSNDGYVDLVFNIPPVNVSELRFDPPTKAQLLG